MINCHDRFGNLPGNRGDFQQIGFELGQKETLEISVWNMKLMVGMSTPMNRKLVDGNINFILNVLLDQLLVERGVTLEKLFDKTV